MELSLRTASSGVDSQFWAARAQQLLLFASLESAYSTKVQSYVPHGAGFAMMSVCFRSLL